MSEMKPGPLTPQTGVPAVPLSVVGQPGGVAQLDGTGVVPDAQVEPAVARVVVHGAVAATARPATATFVHWIGSVAPTNVATNDEWTDTANKITRRWNGSSFDSLGSAASAAFVPGWAANTLYTSGQHVIAPYGSHVTAKANHTSGTSFTAANWNFIGPLDARDFGVKADGTTDDTTAVQAAISAAVIGVQVNPNDRPSTIVQLPVGIIKTTAPLLVPANIVIKGHGPADTIFYPTLALAGDSKTQACFQLSVGTEVQIELRSFQISCQTGTMDGISFAQTGGGSSALGDSRHVIDDIVVIGGSTALALEGSTECRVSNFTAQRCTLVAARRWGATVFIGGSDHMIREITVGQPDVSIGGNAFANHGANTRVVNVKVYGGTGGGPASSAAISINVFRNQSNNLEVQDYNGPAFGLAEGVHTDLIADSCAGPSLVWSGTGGVVRNFLSVLRGGGAYTPQWALDLSDNSAADIEMRLEGTHNAIFRQGTQKAAGNRLRVNGQGGSTVQAAYAATYTPDPLTATDHILAALTGAVTIANPSLAYAQGPYIGMELRFWIPQDATGGRVVTFGTSYKTSAAISTTLSTTTIVTFRYDGTNWRETDRATT